MSVIQDKSQFGVRMKRCNYVEFIQANATIYSCGCVIKPSLCTSLSILIRVLPHSPFVVVFFSLYLFGSFVTTTVIRRHQYTAKTGSFGLVGTGLQCRRLWASNYNVHLHKIYRRAHQFLACKKHEKLSDRKKPQHTKKHARFHQVYFPLRKQWEFWPFIKDFPHETVRSIIVNNNVAFNSTERNIISNIRSSNYGFESLGYLYIRLQKKAPSNETYAGILRRGGEHKKITNSLFDEWMDCPRRDEQWISFIEVVSMEKVRICTHACICINWMRW